MALVEIFLVGYSGLSRTGKMVLRLRSTDWESSLTIQTETGNLHVTMFCQMSFTAT